MTKGSPDHKKRPASFPSAPDGMTIQDFGVSYEELEPYFDQFERVCDTSGKAGNLNGTYSRGRESV